MKRFGSILGLVAMFALAVAMPAYAGGKHHDMKAEVVSIDAQAKMITLKDEKGENHTAPLLGKAVDEAKKLKAGDKVTATCQDTDKGEHEGVSGLKKG